MIRVGDGYSLSEFLRTDRDALVEYLNDRDIYERTLRIPFPYTAAAAEQWFEIVEQSATPSGLPVHWALRNEAGKLIGSVGLEGSSFGRPHRTEIGYWLAKPFWGRGIMTKAVAAACRYAFEVIGLEKITAHIFATNDASARVLEKCGFEQEGFLKRHYQKDGRFLDAKAYGLLR